MLFVSNIIIIIQCSYHHHSGDTGADTARRMTGIPPSANFFSFCYPCEHSRQHRSNLAIHRDPHLPPPAGHRPPPPAYEESFDHPSPLVYEQSAQAAGSPAGGGQLKDTRPPTQSEYSAQNWNAKDPFVFFLCNGGFVYFDYRYEICGIEAVTFDSSKEVNTLLHATRSSSAVFFAQHSVISEKVVEHLTQCGRWWPVTVDEVAKTYSHFAWICPCEAVGGTRFTRWGGFAYLRQTAPQCGVYYPVYTNEKPEEYVRDTDIIAVAEALIKLRDSEERRRDVIPSRQQPQTARSDEGL